MPSKHLSLILVYIGTITHVVSSEYTELSVLAVSSPTAPCIDSPDARFFKGISLQDGKIVPLYGKCERLKRQKKRFITRVCSTNRTFDKRGPAKKICPFTCDMCNDIASASPTTTPSEQTRQPSNAPSISPFAIPSHTTYPPWVSPR